MHTPPPQHTHTATHTLIHIHSQVGLETEDPSQLTTVVQDLEKAVAQAPDFPYAQFTLASAYHRMAGVQQSMQLVETARVKFNDAVKRFPTFADGLVLYALVRVRVLLMHALPAALLLPCYTSDSSTFTAVQAY